MAYLMTLLAARNIFITSNGMTVTEQRIKNEVEGPNRGNINPEGLRKTM